MSLISAAFFTLNFNFKPHHFSSELTLVGVVSAVILLSSLTYEFLLHDEEEVVFIVDQECREHSIV